MIVGLLVASLLSVVPMTAQARCRFFSAKAGGRVVDEASRGSERAAKKCGGGGAGLAGARIGLFRPSATAGYLGRPYGGIKDVAGVVMSAVTVAATKSLPGRARCPWPRADSRTARRHAKDRYNVYQIFYFNKKKKKVDAFKYGITRQGRSSPANSRPDSQLGQCKRHPKTRAKWCRWKWVRVNVKGWHRARRIEGAYCARYVAAKNRRPYGMPRCL